MYQNKIMELISSLTRNEDVQQDLWVIYLSDSSSNLKESLKKIYNRNRIDQKIQRELWRIAVTSPSDYMVTFLDNFSEFEQSIMILLMLGLSLEEVAIHKDMSFIRVQQAVAAIRNSGIWDQFKVNGD